MREIQREMEVVGSCGGHVGIVDDVEGRSVVLKRSGGEGIHHYLPLEWVAGVGQTVRLNSNAEEARARWHLEPFATVEPRPSAWPLGIGEQCATGEFEGTLLSSGATFTAPFARPSAPSARS